jgi:glyoxylase-like metal-dependent hydrolase (beta-lactamase superfamily II)
MSATAFQITIGKIKCIIFSDGCLVDKRPDGDLKVGLNCIYIEAGSRKLLVDVGAGEEFQPTTGQLLSNMAGAGIKGGDIDTIIFDHGHIDHVWGAFDKDGQLVFPNASYVIPKREWLYIKSPPGANDMQNMFYRPARDFLPSVENRLTLADDNYEVVPGIKMLAAYGHTPGNMMVEIVSGGGKLLCIGDIIHAPREFTDPAALTDYDVAPEEALETKAIVLNELAEKGTLVFAGHFTFPGLGYIRRKNGVLSWEAI